MIDRRQNLAHRTAERLRPPRFQEPTSPRHRLINVFRRFFDLQAASIWRDLAKQLPKVRGRLLDVGCGAQPYRVLLSPDVSYLGIDTVEAKSNFGYECADTMYYSGPEWPVETASIDVVLCTETLEHVSDPTAFLGEMHRCLRSDGQAILTVPFAARWHFVPHDYWRFTPAGLNCLLERAGFTDIQVYARGNALTVACYKINWLVFPLFFPSHNRLPVRLGMQLLGLIATPVLLLFTIVGHLTLPLRGEGDCLGYSVFAARKP
jgi:SAM-dependent methyltransferase